MSEDRDIISAEYRELFDGAVQKKSDNDDVQNYNIFRFQFFVCGLRDSKDYTKSKLLSSTLRKQKAIAYLFIISS